MPVTEGGKLQIHDMKRQTYDESKKKKKICGCQG